MQIKDAIGRFFVEYSRFETHSVGMALRSLSRDSVFVEHAEQLLDLEGRLKLLERMAFARAVPPALMVELEGGLLLARNLRERRDEVARNAARADAFDSDSMQISGVRRRGVRRRNADYSRLAALEDLVVPDLASVQTYASEAVELQVTFDLLTQRLEQHLALNAEAA